MSKKTTTTLTLQVTITQPPGKNAAWTVEEVRRLLYNATTLVPNDTVMVKMVTKEIHYD